MRHVAVLGAPSSIGLRPHDETGAPQDVDRAPDTFRDLGLIERLDARDLDPDRSSAARLVELLAQSLLGGGRHAAPA